MPRFPGADVVRNLGLLQTLPTSEVAYFSSLQPIMVSFNYFLFLAELYALASVFILHYLPEYA